VSAIDRLLTPHHRQKNRTPRHLGVELLQIRFEVAAVKRVDAPGRSPVTSPAQYLASGYAMDGAGGAVDARSGCSGTPLRSTRSLAIPTSGMPTAQANGVAPTVEEGTWNCWRRP
jgi:hypothetical protein